MTCYVPTCLRAHVPNFLTCQRAMTCYVPTCQRAYVPNFLTCQRAMTCYVPTCLWPNFLTCQCAIACYVQTCKRSCPSCANLPAYQIVVCGPFVGSFLNFWPSSYKQFLLRLIFLHLPRVVVSKKFWIISSRFSPA